jgi:hypothetical protein
MSIKSSSPRPSSSSKTRIPLSTANPIYFIPERNPLLPPTHRASELPMSSQSETSPVQVHGYVGNQGTGMDSQGDEFEDEDDFDGIEDVSPSQIVLPSVKRSSTGAAMIGNTLADLFSDDEMEEPLAMFSARKQTNQRSQSKF